MFFVADFQYNSIYNRRCKTRVRFISYNITDFSIKNAQYNYLCDQEFLEYLWKISNTIQNVNKVESMHRNYTFIIESFPEEIQTLLSISKDVVGAFKTYLNDEKLDKLAKE